MKDAPVVSVLTCFLNANTFLEEAIESVLAQTLESWELLLVDDGSNDGSTETARRFAERYPRKVRYLEHPGHENRGSSASRNRALRHARGEFVAILDADDVLLPSALERRVALLRGRPEIGMVYGPALLWHGWTGDANDQRRDREERHHAAAGTVFAPLEYTAYLLDYDADMPSPCTVLIRRSAIDRAGGFEDSFRNLFDDQVLYLKISLRSAVLVSRDCDSRYRQHADSVCARSDREGATDAARRIYLDWVKRYLREQGVGDRRVWRALRSLSHRFHRPRLFRLGQFARRLSKRVMAP